MRKRKFSKNRTIDVTNTEVKKDTKKKYMLIFVAIMVFTMVFSVLTINLGNTDSEEPESSEYNGFKFLTNGNMWQFDIQGIDYMFEYSPESLENIESITLKNFVFGEKVYVLFNPSEHEAAGLEVQKLRRFFVSKRINVNLACTEEKGCGDLPIIDCRNPNKVVYLKIGDKNMVYTEDNCIVLDALKGEELKVINRFIYGVLGVINDS